MIIDSHCHIWARWPYQPPVPDPESRARAEQLLFEMDRAGIEHAVVICAAIDGNPRNADYAFEMAERHRGRFTIFPDLECRWSPDYQRPGAAARLQAALRRWDFKGFTLYPRQEEDCSWFCEEEGQALFALAAERKLIASLSILPHHMPQVMAVARRHPDMPILCHHLAHLGPRTGADPSSLASVLDGASCPNIHIKLSGMGNVSAGEDEFPYPRLQPVFAALGSAYGEDRLVWGSDYPVSRRHMTYGQALSMVQRHMGFSPNELSRIMGGTMSSLLGL